MKPSGDISGIIDGFAGAARPSPSKAPHALFTRAHDLYELTKPRMNFLVVITTMAGFYMALDSGSPPQWRRLLATLLGTAMTAAGASVLNQWAERDADALMQRTRGRPIPAGRMAPRDALLFGLALAVAGVAFLAASVNLLTAALGAFTLLSYVLVYTPLKRVTTLCTIVGAVPGAIPPVMGMTAINGVISQQAVALFAILFVWQMPHFLAIAVMYKADYAAGGFRMLPVVDDDRLSATCRQMLLYGLCLIPVSLVPSLLGMAGTVYFTCAVLLGVGFLSFGASCAATRSRADARKLFFASIVYLPVLLGMMLADKT